MPKPPVAPLAGPTVRLRLLEEADLPLTLRWRNADHIRRWFVYSAVLTWEQHRGWFEKYREKDDDYLFVMELAGRPVGQAGLYKIDRAVGVCEFGRILVGEADAAGRGLAGEATELLLGLAFRTWALTAVELEVFTTNERAIRVYRRCGFEPVGEPANGLTKMRVTADGYLGRAALPGAA